ncbi:hypothetical protein FDW84_18500 (plasmid) [Pseudarthrobacter sp. NamE5]|nr:hypothetical protein FDW84_18500 [Pseudarthrobacter sp. NamE5]
MARFFPGSDVGRAVTNLQSINHGLQAPPKEGLDGVERARTIRRTAAKERRRHDAGAPEGNSPPGISRPSPLRVDGPPSGTAPPAAKKTTVSLSVVGLGLTGSVGAGCSACCVTRKNNCPLGCVSPDLSAQGGAAGVGLSHVGGLIRSLPSLCRLWLITVLPRSDSSQEPAPVVMRPVFDRWIRKEGGRVASCCAEPPNVIGVDCAGVLELR